jgi:hypothetical protein
MDDFGEGHDIEPEALTHQIEMGPCSKLPAYDREGIADGRAAAAGLHGDLVQTFASEKPHEYLTPILRHVSHASASRRPIPDVSGRERAGNGDGESRRLRDTRGVSSMSVELTILLLQYVVSGVLAQGFGGYLRKPRRSLS